MSAMKLCGKMTEVLKDIGVDILTLGPLNEPESPLDHDGVDLLDTMILSDHVPVNSYHILLKTSDQNDVDSPSSARDEGAQNEDSEINSLEVPICSEAGNSDENIQDSFGQLVTQFHGNDTSDIHNTEVLCTSQMLSNTHMVICASGAVKQAENWRQLSNNHPDSWKATETLAQVHHKLGELRLVRDLQAIVLEKRRLFLGDDDLDTLDIMTDLAATYHALGQLKKAEEFRVAVLERRVRNSLASTYWQLGKVQMAEGLETVKLVKQRKAIGKAYLGALPKMVDLATTYCQQGQLKKAEELFIVVLEKQRVLFGEDHPETLPTMSNLASTYGRNGLSRKAQEIYTELLAKHRELLGDDHPDTLKTMAGLASTYEDLGLLKMVEILNMAMLEKQRQLLGDGGGLQEGLVDRGMGWEGFLDAGSHICGWEAPG
ncbi:hypothetical protein B0H14DRAFT_2594454 [Mycena olivaceomarginata]|nr:hypothetical protein B0H14DRAFT_2594454 [Mycena olivaceomarginata]